MRTPLVAFILITLVAYGAQGRQAPPKEAWSTPPSVLPVGPSDAMDTPRQVYGNVRVVVTLSKRMRPAQVEVFVGDRSLGKSDRAPYKQEFDAGSLPKGRHIVRAVGYDSEGRQIWRASSAIRTGGPAPEKPQVVTQIASEEPMVEQIGAPLDDFDDQAPTTLTLLDHTYVSRNYGFSINYPLGWVCRDLTSKMKPKVKNGCWIVFAPDSNEKTPVVVNVRREAFGAGTEAFEKSHPYVRTWEKTSLAGSPAYRTTSTEALDHETVHRAIILKNGNAWMLNCRVKGTDQQALAAKWFGEMAESLRVLER